jgi:hypothetical protein
MLSLRHRSARGLRVASQSKRREPKRRKPRSMPVMLVHGARRPGPPSAGHPEHILALRPCTLLARFHSRFCELQENTREGAEAHLIEHFSIIVLIAVEILRTTDPPTQHRHVLAHLQRVTDSTDRGGCVGCANVARMGPSFDAPRKQDIVNHSRVHATTPRGSTVEWRARAGHEITHTVAALVALVVSQQIHPFVDPPHTCTNKHTVCQSERRDVSKAS